MKKLFYKIISVLLSFLMVVNYVDIQNCFAASKTLYFNKTIEFIDYAKETKFYISSGRLTKRNREENQYCIIDTSSATVKGNFLYCIEPGASLSSGTQATSNNNASSLFRNDKSVGGLSADEKKLLVSYIGGRSDFMKTYNGSTSWKEKARYLAAQTLIWEVAVSERKSDFTLVSRSSSASWQRIKSMWVFKDFTTASGNVVTKSESQSYFNSIYDKWVSQIQNEIKSLKRPSFTTASESSAKTISLTLDSTNNYSQTITDENQVVSLFNASSIAGVTIKTSANKVTFSSSKDIDDPVVVKYSSSNSINSGVVNGWIPGTSQKVISIGTTSSTQTIGYVKLKTDSVKTGSLKIKKVDNEFGYALKNVEFKVQSENGYDEVFVTDENGEIFIDNLPLGKYSLQEINVPNGYLLDESIYEVEITRENSMTSLEITVPNISDTIVGRLHVYKVDDNNDPLMGAQFKIVAAEDITDPTGQYTYYKNGDVVAENLEVNAQGELIYYISREDEKNGLGNALHLGSYQLIETKAPEGYILNTNPYDFKITYQDHSTKIIEKSMTVMNNSTVVSVAKLDAESLKGLSGAHLQILSEDGETVIESWTSTSEPYFIKNLEVGKTYVLREIEAPNGYLKSDEIKFTVKDSKDVQEIVMKDQPIKGQIEIIKTGEVLTDYKEPLDLFGIKLRNEQFVYETQSLDGVSFDIYAKENIINPSDNSIIYKAGSKIDTIVTKDGKAKSQLLPLGQYEVIETKTLSGLVLDKSERTVNLTEVDKMQSVVVSSLNVLNKHQTIKLSVIKKDRDSKNVLENAEFSLYTKEDLKDYLGNIIVKKDTLISKAMSNKDGIANFDIDLPMGIYYVKETKAPAGYSLNNEIIEFDTTNNSGEEIVIISDEVLDDVTKVSFTKLDITDNKELAGASLEIRDENNLLIDSWVSTEEPHYIYGLLANKEYTLIETIPAEGYTTANKVTFTVKDTSEVQKVVMKDDITRFDISKVDITTREELSGATLEVRDENDKVIDTWISTKEPHRIEKLIVGKTYTLIEIDAPEGYVKAESIKFIVEDTNEIQLITMKDKHVSISKHDITTDLELEGAFLQVIEKETNQVVDQWVSTKEEHKVNGLEEGKEYVLKEINAPYGYEVAKSIEFIVSGEMEDGIKVNQNIIMKDELILTSITINKIDSINKKKIINLNFEFGLYADKECQNLIMSQQSNTGTIVFEDLMYGVYYLKELKAPDGYNLSDEVVEIVVDDTLKTVNHNYTIDFENNSYIRVQTSDDFRIGVYLLGMVISIIYMIYEKFKLKRYKKIS